MSLNVPLHTLYTCKCNVVESFILITHFHHQMSLVIIFIIAVIMYRVLIAIPLFQNRWIRSEASIIASLTAACVNLVLIMALSLVYEKLALKLTQWGWFLD